MNITVLGAGYVGLVTAACFAELGHRVTCVDVNQEKIDHLNLGIIPIYEPGLETLVVKNLQIKRLSFVSSLQSLNEANQIIFIAVGTPPAADGGVNTEYVLNAAKMIGNTLETNALIVDKSTVPVGVADLVKNIIEETVTERQLSLTIEMVSNPEFLREGSAINDFMSPDRIIIGCQSAYAKTVMSELYNNIIVKDKIYWMSVKDAEMTKYVANAMLATKISLMNEVALICEKVNVDVENVRLGIGSDSRIGPAFINAGCGYGGSCFPKDIKALINIAETNHIQPIILHAVENRNDQQKKVLFDRIAQYFHGNLKGLTVALWGLAFKPNTDDIREASSFILIENLIDHGAKILAYDPIAISNTKKIMPKEWLQTEKIIFTEDHYTALRNADALVLVTEWDLFLKVNITKMKSLMRQPVVFDGRNHFDPTQFHEAGFFYYGIGRGNWNVMNMEPETSNTAI